MWRRNVCVTLVLNTEFFLLVVNDAESSVVVEVVVPCRQAVHGVGRHLRFAPFTVVAAVSGGSGGQRRHADLGDRPGHHVVGGPGRLIRSGGQRPPLQPGVLATQRGALRWRGRGQLPQGRGQGEGLVSVGGGDLWRRGRSRKSDNTALAGSQGSDSHSCTVSELSGVCGHLGCGSLRPVAAWRPLLLQQVQPRRHRGQLGHRGGRPLHLQ